MIGLGTQDSLEMAEEFRSTTGTESVLMTWDASFETWAYYGIRSQPNAILVSATGEPLGAWRGRLPVDEVQAAIDAA